jgi:hypothetical protein
VRRFQSTIFTALLVAPMTALASNLPFAALPAVMQVTVPEYWSVSDSVLFFVVALGIFSLLVRSRIRMSSRTEKKTKA